MLTGFLFGFIWPVFLFKSITDVTNRRLGFLKGVTSVIIPFANIPVMLAQHKKIKEIADSKNIKLLGKPIVYVLTGILFPILPLDIVGLSIMQSDVNRILEK